MKRDGGKVDRDRGETKKKKHKRDVINNMFEYS